MGRRPGLVAWTLVLAAGWGALAVLGYRARDADSRLYAEIAARMSEAPAAGWIAPDFPPGWYMSGRFREHPAGLFVPAAALARLGYPAAQAAYALNALYQVLTIVLLQRLAATLVPGLEARALGWLVQLLPIAFTFRIRANHEQAVLLCLVAALYGIERARTRPRWALLTAVGLVGLLAGQGRPGRVRPGPVRAVAPRPPSRPPRRRRRTARPGSASPPASRSWLRHGAVYEHLYRQVTGEHVLVPVPRAPARGGRGAGGGAGVAAKLYNLVWYTGRVLWFPFPGAWPSRGRVARTVDPAVDRNRRWTTSCPRGPRGGGVRRRHPRSLRGPLQPLRPPRRPVHLPRVLRGGRRGSGGRAAGVDAAPPLAERLDRPWVPAAVWAVAFCAHLFAGRLGLPTVKVWTP